ncbi:MAG TPA: endo-1,4-beta-xylanase [Chitinophagaceae bacterium]|nr:endo-1,4-beta-xylanase [Chitinophagaceae bacterium]
MKKVLYSKNLSELTIFFAIVAGLFFSCNSSKNITADEEDISSLKDVFKKDFLIGAALNANEILQKDPKADALIQQQFDAITPENVMKCEVINPQWGVYNFDLADKYVEYGNEHHMAVIAHNLIWHSQLAPFVRKIKNADSLRQFMTDHITTIASRYDGKIKGWDVVNEALNEDGTMRKSIFEQSLGDDFVTEAFRLAQKAAPHTELYYNDYNIEQPAKRAGCIALIKKIQAAGVRIDGVGIQGHWHLGKIPLKDIEESIQQFSALGIKVMITELDIDVLNRNVQGADVNQRMQGTAQMNPYVNGLPDSVQQQLADDYSSLFKLFVKYKDKISRVTFWGVNDGQSWLNGWPIPGRTNYPLLFDREFKPKPAFYKVIEAKKNSGKEAKAF